MKQHITIEQLNELSEKGKKILGEWWKPSLGDRVYSYYDGRVNFEGTVFNNDQANDDYHHSIGVICTAEGYECECAYIEKVQNHKELYYPLLSIGQMIEFLVEHNYLEGIYKIKGGFETDRDGISPKEELVDVLWEEAKGVLENE